MRNLLLQCTCVRTYVLVTLRNVNLRSPSECQFALMPGQDTGYVLHDVRTFFWLRRMGRAAWLALCDVRICRAKCINEC